MLFRETSAQEICKTGPKVSLLKRVVQCCISDCVIYALYTRKHARKEDARERRWATGRENATTRLGGWRKRTRWVTSGQKYVVSLSLSLSLTRPRAYSSPLFCYISRDICPAWVRIYLFLRFFCSQVASELSRFFFAALRKKRGDETQARARVRKKEKASEGACMRRSVLKRDDSPRGEERESYGRWRMTD